MQEDCLRFKHPFNDPTESDIEEANIELNLLDEDEDDEFVSVDLKENEFLRYFEINVSLL